MLDTTNFAADFKRAVRIYIVYPFIALIPVTFIIVSCTEEDSSIHTTVNEKSATAAKWDDDIVAPKIDDQLITETKAQLLCFSAYRNAATYDHDVCVWCTEVLDTDIAWVVKVDGKLQNAFGAWAKIQASCVVNKKTHQITSFEFRE